MRENNDMKLFLLRPKKELEDNVSIRATKGPEDNPWKPWYDKIFGFVIRAKDENNARKIADKNAGDENRGEFLNNKTANTKNPWLDEKYSTCVELKSEGKEEVIIRDFASA